MSASKRFTVKTLAGASVLACTLAVSGQAHAQATIIINNINAPGVGFNDPTPAVPVGGNTGTTVGEQRLIAFTYAANIWGATLTSSVPIVVNAQFSPLTCTATGGVLGSAGATQVFANFAGSQKTNTWYAYALANKLAATDLATTPGPQINSNFNSNLGSPGCLETSGWYYGLDGKEGTLIDFVAVLQHEMGHGLGFQTFTNGSTGAFFSGRPSIWDHYLFSVAANKNWADTSTTAAERAASAISVNGLVWTGANVTTAVPSVLRLGQAAVTISGVAAGAGAGTYLAGDASFGPPVLGPSISGEILPVADQGAGPGCTTFNRANALAVNGKIALIDRGACAFALKAKNAQNAGAIGVVIANNAAGLLAPGGGDPTVTIPVLGITQAQGNTIKSALQTRSRSKSGVVASFGVSGTQYTGADILGRAQMFAPNPFQGGSSVSHFDSAMFRNQLMEPAINGDLTQSVLPPEDMTFRLYQDIGW